MSILIALAGREAHPERLSGMINSVTWKAQSFVVKSDLTCQIIVFEDPEAKTRRQHNELGGSCELTEAHDVSSRKRLHVPARLPTD